MVRAHAVEVAGVGSVLGWVLRVGLDSGVCGSLRGAAQAEDDVGDDGEGAEEPEV